MSETIDTPLEGMPASPRGRRVLLVSHRPMQYGGGGSARWRYLSRALPERGWDVDILTARANPTANEASTDAREAWLAATRARVMNRLGGTVRPLYQRAGLQPEAFAPNILWSVTGRPAIRRAIARLRPDVVWATGPPAAAMFAAVPEAARAGVPAIVEFRDLWAGNPYFDGGGSLLARLETPPLHRASAVVTVTPGCVEALRALHPELGPKLRLLPNGFDPALLDRRAPAPPRGPADRVVLVHAGTLYADRTAESLLRALAAPDLRSRVRLELIGPIDDRTADAIRAAPPELDVEVSRPVTWETAILRTSEADISVAINSPGTGGHMALPGKLFEALAIGRPILALTPPGSDTERLLAGLGQDGGCVAPDDIDAIADAVRALVRHPPAPVPLDRLSTWSRSTVADSAAELLASLAPVER